MKRSLSAQYTGYSQVMSRISLVLLDASDCDGYSQISMYKFTALPLYRYTNEMHANKSYPMEEVGITVM
jgi:hypothetical protein